MENFRPQAKWSSSTPKSKVVNVHFYIACTYIFAFLVLATSFFGGQKAGAMTPLTIAAPFLVLALAFAHYQTSKAVDRERGWALTVSEVLALPLFFAFPVGTIFSLYLISNLRALRKQAKA